MLVTVGMLQILDVREDEKEGADDGDSVARLIRNLALEKYSHGDEEETT